MLVLVQTARRRYAVRRDDVTAMRLVADAADLAAIGTPERPAIPVDLGELLDPEDRGEPGRRHGLVVPMRRRPIVFLVTRVEGAHEVSAARPLPALVARGLLQPWSVGVLEISGELAVLLDLRAIARSVLAQRSPA